MEKIKELTKDRKAPLEFLLILFMLVALIFLVWGVLYAPIVGKTAEDFDASTILDYRSNLFSGLLTAFGAWIGAGAAYFFGRESLKEAYAGMKSLQQPSITERLKQIKLKDIPPKALSWRPKLSEKLQKIFDRLDKEPSYWFIPIFNEEDKLQTVKTEEVIWKYYRMKMDEGKKTIDETSAEIRKIGIKEFLDDLKESPFAEKFEHFKDPYVRLELTDNLYYANMQLNEKVVDLAIINDENGNARYYVTASEFRQYMASI